MAYADFDVVTAEERLGVRVLVGPVFPPLAGVAVPAWLTDSLARGDQLRVASEKARNEFIVAPILLAVRELSGNRVTIFSGESLDVDRSLGLNGELDFLLALDPATPAYPVIRAPLIAIVEAERQDIEGAIGQCAAQMVAAQRYNERHGRSNARVYGCVTTGEVWQFLRLDADVVTCDATRLFRDRVGGILAAFLHVVSENAVAAAA